MTLASRAASASLTSHTAIIKTLANKYHPTINPDGFVNLAVAENALLNEELTTYINANAIFNPLHLTYGNGGSGSEQLRSTIALFLNRRFHPRNPLTASSMHCTAGLTNAIEGIAFALADPGEAFLLARPFYGSFPHIIGDRPGLQTIRVTFGETDPFSIESITYYVSALENAAKSGVRARGIILCNPHNPLGHAYSIPYLRALMAFADKYNLHIISDEIYALSSWTNPSHPNTTNFTSVLAIDLTNLIDPALVHCLWGTSKDFGASGLRLGAVISPHNPQLLAALSTRGLYTFPSAATDAIVQAVLRNEGFCNWYFKENMRRLTEAYGVVTKFLVQNRIPYAQGGGGAFFVWVNLGEALEKRIVRSTYGEAGGQEEQADAGVAQLQSSLNADLMARLIEKKVYLASGDAFGSEKPGWFRIVFAQPQEIILEGLHRMLHSIEGGAAKEKYSATLPVCLCV